MPINKKTIFWYLILSIAGLIISIYLFIPYYQDADVALCATGSGCDAVKNSGFSHFFGWRHWFWSLPFWGMVFYSFLAIYNLTKFFVGSLIQNWERKISFQPDLVAISIGFLFSVYLTGLEAFVIIAWCSFCLLQAVVATLYFVTFTYNNLAMVAKQKLRFLLEVFSFVAFIYLIWWLVAEFWSVVGSLWITCGLLIVLLKYILIHFPLFASFTYRYLLKPIFFQFDAEQVHNFMVNIGQTMSRISPVRSLVGRIYGYKPANLYQKFLDVDFTSPVGLSAGFDYNGRLTGVLGQIGFGFESAGTVTFSAYEGNARPRLGRLPKSRSLLVNKGFKNLGLEKILSKNLSNLPTTFPVGLSLGATNSPNCATTKTQIEDILKSFEKVKDREDFAYLELNISCPNVRGSGSLAKPEALRSILPKLQKMNLKRPLFVKFPAEIEWAEARELVRIMINNQVAGVIVSNLVKDRANSDFDRAEIEAASKGNFSGKPVEKFSNELIKNIYREFKGQILIVGLGGIFTAEDAYTKIKLGANLVQLITGMIYGGPAAIWQINQELSGLLAKDGYENVSEAVGVGN